MSMTKSTMTRTLTRALSGIVEELGQRPYDQDHSQPRLYPRSLVSGLSKKGISMNDSSAGHDATLHARRGWNVDN